MNEDWNALNNTEVNEMLGNECYTLNCSCINQSMIGALAPKVNMWSQPRPASVARARLCARKMNQMN